MVSAHEQDPQSLHLKVEEKFVMPSLKPNLVTCFPVLLIVYNLLGWHLPVPLLVVALALLLKQGQPSLRHNGVALIVEIPMQHPLVISGLVPQLIPWIVLSPNGVLGVIVPHYVDPLAHNHEPDR
eukprot:c25893_g1_i1.p2 GENE.c25893_g1_i1~~c25893_g1_i1.p2  ORF type:complete len:125 (+),score=6.00 c25893_g1_i1:2294-2668(+)